MVEKVRQDKKTPLFKKEDYILYILNNLEPEKSDKIRLNKVAFFVEFAFVHHNSLNDFISCSLSK
ncbi:MAG: hypothetical protein CMI55_03545 [Parcubacteria group bacterium]|jgi:hypothetical protein|nr:hypothetical protein [Parcubacteria group bacterium]